jgi:hypothetical protein
MDGRGAAQRLLQDEAQAHFLMQSRVASFGAARLASIPLSILMATPSDFDSLDPPTQGENLRDYLRAERVESWLRIIKWMLTGGFISFDSRDFLVGGAPGGILVKLKPRRSGSSGSMESATTRPFQLKIAGSDAEPKISVYPGTFSAGANDVSVTSEDCLEDAPSSGSRDLVLVVNLLAGSHAIEYVGEESSDIVYYATGIASLESWQFQLVSVGESPGSTRAEVSEVTGSPTVEGVYFIRIGRVDVVDGKISVLNYKFGHIQISLCIGGDLHVSAN